MKLCGLVINWMGKPLEDADFTGLTTTIEGAVTSTDKDGMVLNVETYFLMNFYTRKQSVLY